MNDLDIVVTTTNGTTATISTATARAIIPIPILVLRSQSRLRKVEEGLRLIISHFDPTEPLWPRKISTRATGGKQIVVNSFEEAIKCFKAANFSDCRISTYPIYRDEYVKRTGILFVPSLLLVDIDREHSGTDEEFEAAAAKTITNFNEILGASPTWLWTGGGYHFLLPQSVMVLEKIDDFNQFVELHPSRKFLHFEEWLMTDGRADQNHNRTVSFKNCMLRVPGSLNFGACQRNDKDEITGVPPEAEVRVVRSWDGNRPDVNHLIPRCWMWLKAAAIKDMQKRIEADKVARKYNRRRSRNEKKKTTFQWIEKLLEKPIDSNRYYCVWRILVPYLINVKGTSRQDARNIILSWLDRCNSVKRLSFSTKQKVDYELGHVGSYYPIARADLEEDNNLLFQRLKNEGVIF